MWWYRGRWSTWHELTSHPPVGICTAEVHTVPLGGGGIKGRVGRGGGEGKAGGKGRGRGMEGRRREGREGRSGWEGRERGWEGGEGVGGEGRTY